MTRYKTFAVSLIALAAIATPASALDHKDHGRKHKYVNTHFGIDMNIGPLRISNYYSGNRYMRARTPLVYIELEGSRHRRDHQFSRFEDRVRYDFSRNSHGNFRIADSRRHADFVIRLDRDDWGRAYKRYTKAGHRGDYRDRRAMRSKMVEHVSHRLLSRANDMRKHHYKRARYDRYEGRRDQYRSDRHDRQRSNERHARYSD